MRSPRNLRRVALGAALAGAAFGEVPAIASAASTCTLDETTHHATVIDGSAAAPLRIRLSQGKFIVVQDGSGPLIGCDGTTTFATNTNTDRVIVQGAAGSSSSDGYIIDHSHGALAPGATAETDGSSEIEVQVRQLNGLPAQLTHIATAGPDTIRVAAGNDIAVGTDDDIDENIFNPNGGAYRASKVVVSGGAGADFLSGRGVPGFTGGPASVPLDLSGGTGDDTVVDGASSGDHIGGDEGTDTLFSVDGRPDFVNGGGGTDSASADKRIDSVDPDVESVSFGSVGRLRLASTVVRARAGRTARLGLSWTHPTSWRELKMINVTVYRGAEPLGNVYLRTRDGRIMGHGALQLVAGASRVAHSGKTVRVQLAVRLARSLAGETLRIGVKAADQHGHQQTVPEAGELHVAK